MAVDVSDDDSSPAHQDLPGRSLTAGHGRRLRTAWPVEKPSGLRCGR